MDFNLKVMIIAEAGVNHNGDIELARRLIDAASAAHVDAVKFQTFSVDRLVMPNAPLAAYQRQSASSAGTQYEMLKQLELSKEDHRQLKSYCDHKKLAFLSSPFDEQSSDFLESLGVEAFKIPSGEITNIPFLKHVASKGLPMIVSTGMSTLDEVRLAVDAIRISGNPPLALLHCTSNYPADPADANLHAMLTMRNAFQVPIGYSDHTMGMAISLAAVALDACIIEKHFTLDRSLPGPDHKASLLPHELKDMVANIRLIESSMGDGEKRATEAEKPIALLVRKSLFAAIDIPAGTFFSPEHVIARRPCNGMSPAHLHDVLGKRTRMAIQAGQSISWDMFL